MADEQLEPCRPDLSSIPLFLPYPRKHPPRLLHRAQRRRDRQHPPFNPIHHRLALHDRIPAEPVNDLETLLIAIY